MKLHAYINRTTREFEVFEVEQSTDNSRFEYLGTIEITPPKKKVKKWQFLCRNVDGSYWMTGRHYSSAKEFDKEQKSPYKGITATVIKPIQETEIEEVEE
jgi:hypothetical protein